MIIRQGLTEEERRRLHQIHVLDYSCLGIAALIVVLTILGFVYGMEETRLGDAVLLLGAVLNLGLAARAAVGQLRPVAAGAAVLAVLCVGGFLYLEFIR